MSPSSRRKGTLSRVVARGDVRRRQTRARDHASREDRVALFERFIRRYTAGDAFDERPDWLPDSHWFGAETAVFLRLGLLAGGDDPLRLQEQHERGASSDPVVAAERAFIVAIGYGKRICDEPEFQQLTHDIADDDVVTPIEEYVARWAERHARSKREAGS